MKDLMIDIETLGSKPGAIIFSIGAVEFDIETGRMGSLFYQNIDINTSIKEGLIIEVDTVMWWLEQSKEAQLTITSNKGNPLRNVLRSFATFIADNFHKDVKVWGNSARFDLGILEAAYNKCGYDIPWKYYNERDVRTLVSFAPQIKDNMVFQGIKHYPIDDCKHQIKYCSEIYNTLKTT